MRRLVLAASMLVLAGQVAYAGEVAINFTGGVGVTAYFYVNGSRSAVGTLAGDSEVLVTNADGLAGLPGSFFTFCVDLQRLADTSASAALGSMADWDLLAGATDAQRLGASYLANKYFSLYPDGSADNLTAAYYQVAIWELLHERQTVTSFAAWKVTGGSTYFNSGTLTAGAQGLIRGIDTGSPLFTYAGQLITPDHNGYGQNFVAPTATPVPDGGTTLMLLGGALIGLDILRRRLRP